MRRIKDICKIEWTYLSRSRIWSLVPFLHLIYWIWLIVLYETDANGGSGTRMAYYYTHFMTIMPVAMLICGLYANYIVQRDRRSGMEQLILAWPVKKTEWLAGKWLAAQWFGLAFTVPAALVQMLWLAASGSGEEPLLAYFIYTCLQMGAALSFFISLGLLIGVCIRSRFGFLLLPILWWVLFTIRMDTTESGSIHVLWRWLAPYDLTRFYYNIVRDSRGLWGIPWTALHQGVVAAASLLVAVLACLSVYAHRNGKRESLILLASSAALLLIMLAGGWISYSEFAGRIDSYRHDGATYAVDSFETYYEQGYGKVVSDFCMKETALSLRFPGNNQLAARAELLLVQTEEAQSSLLELTLNRRLYIKSLTSDLPMEWEREGDLLTIRLTEPLNKNGSLRLGLTYEGAVESFRNMGLSRYSYITDSGITLPKALAWYPQLGSRMLTKSFEHNGAPLGFIMRHEFPYVEPDSTHYVIKLEGERSGSVLMPIPAAAESAAVFEGSSSGGLFFYEGIMEERSIGGVRVIDHPDLIDESIRKVKKQLDQIAFLNRWLKLELKAADLYSGIILFENVFANIDYRVQSPSHYVDLPEVKSLSLEMLLKWIYEQQFPSPGRAPLPDFRSHYELANPTRSVDGNLTADQLRFVEEIEKLDRSDWSEIVAVGAKLYEAYVQSGKSESFDPLPILRQLTLRKDGDT